MALTKDERRKLDETHEGMGEVRTVLLGAKGDIGLVGEFRELAKSHYKLRRNFWMLIAFLVGSGIITTGVIFAVNGTNAAG